MTARTRTGLVLSGGGARAAYQVGVLQAIAAILREAGWAPQRNPFDIVCGTSAGSINAVALACRADRFDEAVDRLAEVWSDFSAEQVYRADSLGVLRSGARWLSLLSCGWLLRRWHAHPPASLLDNTPLVTLLHRMLDLPRLDAAMEAGRLHALAVTASSYTAGNHVTFYQSAAGIEPWRRKQRRALRDQIGVNHLLASSAIPFVFPAMPLFCEGRIEYFGDGSMRQLSPISPAIHLGADKVVVVGVGRAAEASVEAGESGHYPTLAQVAGHALSGIFLDSVAADVERLERINRTLAALDEAGHRKLDLRPVEMLLISPSASIDEIAARHVGSLPAPIRAVLGVLGATEARGGALAAYLLFEADFTVELMALGRRDTFARRRDVEAFFGTGADAVGQAVA